jgi:hypothetical protein
VKRIRAGSPSSLLDLLLLAAGAALGAAVGYVASGSFGRVTAHRVQRGLKRRRWARGDLRPGDWSDDDADTLTARVLDLLWAHPVLARRAIRVRVLGPGLVELAGHVESHAEGERAGQLVRRLPGVRELINRLLVPGVDTPVPVVSGPSSPRAARG